MGKKSNKQIDVPKTSRKALQSSAVSDAAQIKESDTYMYGGGGTTIATLLGSGPRVARARQAIYQKWSIMESDPVVSAALSLRVTAALGRHETTGQIVFIEPTPKAKADRRLAAIVEDMAAHLGPMFNQCARTVARTAIAFGDAYGRIYTDSQGVADIDVDEKFRPPLVQPFERGSKTVGYASFLGERGFEKLNANQMARAKMPRTQWIPQYGVVEKSLRIHIREDSIDALPVLPSMVGGSVLYNAESSFDNLTASLLGLVGQRWMDSIDESMMAVNLASMTKEQQDRFIASVTDMLASSKARAEAAVKNGAPVMERIRHIIPVFGDKQVTTVGPMNGGQPGRSGNITVDDVMLHARLLAGSLGVDLSMIGFADQLSGGLGEGGYFRTSAQIAEGSGELRGAMDGFYNHISDIHTMSRYGMVFSPQERPWVINFYGSISAFEAEKQRTRTDAMNSGMLMVQAMQMLKEMGATEEIMQDFLSHDMMLDENRAKLLAQVVKAKPPDNGDGPGMGETA